MLCDYSPIAPAAVSAGGGCSTRLDCTLDCRLDLTAGSTRLDCRLDLTGLGVPFGGLTLLIGAIGAGSIGGDW